MQFWVKLWFLFVGAGRGANGAGANVYDEIGVVGVLKVSIHASERTEFFFCFCV
jgi:hypothetical protein